MLSDKIQNIETDLAKLNNIQDTDIKKFNETYNNIKDELTICKQDLVSIEKKIETLLDNMRISNDENIPITNDVYEEYMKDIKIFKDNSEYFDIKNVEDQIKIFEDVIKKIILCENYLKAKKKSIIYIDK
jgi:hypothetical protein